MTQQDRQNWLDKLVICVATDLKTKYEAGQQEHQGDLGEVPVHQLLKEMYQEHLDSIAYIAELKRRTDASDHVYISRPLLAALIELANENIPHETRDLLNQLYARS